MWMTDYIRAVKIGFRDQHGFVPNPDKSSEHELVFDQGAIPDGEYPMTIEGKLDRVRVENGGINCCNFD